METSPNPSSPRTWSQSIAKTSPMSWMSPSSRKSRTVRSPKPSMSSAPRDAKCSIAPWIWYGHWRSTQRVSLSPSGRTSVLSRGHGQVVGNAQGLERFGRSASTGPTTSGMTSPARRTITVSPGRTSLARTWSSLCSVAWPTLAPPTNTGSSRA